MDEIIEVISKILGKTVTEKTEILSIVKDTEMGVGDLLDLLCEEIGGRISNDSFPRTVGDIKIK